MAFGQQKNGLEQPFRTTISLQVLKSFYNELLNSTSVEEVLWTLKFINVFTKSANQKDV